MYTQDMPVVALSNVSTRLGIVNGAQGTAVRVVPHPGGMLYSYFITLSHADSLQRKIFRDLSMLCTLPPKCILFEPNSTNSMIFPGMGSTAMPVFCSSSPVKTGNMSVTRHQVPITPAWAITEHKAQGSTFDTVIVDLHWQDTGHWRQT
jgi:hypothetical protein